MKIESRSLIRWACSFVFAFMLVGCGGGATAEGETNVASRTQPLVFDSTNVATASASAIGYSEVGLQFGQVAVDLISKLQDAGTTASITESCLNGGRATATISLTDANRDGKPSSGDSLNVNWRDCYVPIFGEVFSGSATIRIVEANQTSTPNLKATLDLSTGVELQLRNLPTSVVLKFLGSLSLEWGKNDFQTSLKVTSSQADDFRLEAKGPARTATEAFKNLTLSKDLRYDEARSVVAASMRYESDVLGGALMLSTAQPMRAYLNRSPEVGQIELRGAGRGVLTLRPNLVTQSSAYVASLDSDDDGEVETRIAVDWSSSSVGFLWSDGPPRGIVLNAPYVIEYFSPKDFTFKTDYVDNFGSQDAWRIQFTRPLIDGERLKFRFKGPAGSDGAEPTYVSTTTDMRGARLLIRPSQTLRHNQLYLVEISIDGGEWTKEAGVRDTLGNTVVLSNLHLTTPDSMAANIVSNTGILGSPQAMAQLDAGTSTSRRPIASYSWRQLNGTPLVFTNQNASKTGLKWGSVAPRQAEEIAIELTIRDVEGDIESSRTTIFVYDPASAPANLFYVRSMTGEYIGRGRTWLFSDATGTFSDPPVSGWAISYYYNPFNSPNLYTWGVSMRAPNFEPIRVGSYEYSNSVESRGSTSAMDVSQVHNACYSNISSGRFEVLELVTNAQGVITNLAVDFEHHCGGPTSPALLGSLRVKSSIPIFR